MATMASRVRATGDADGLADGGEARAFTVSLSTASEAEPLQ
jgi:hypothetical protein